MAVEAWLKASLSWLDSEVTEERGIMHPIQTCFFVGGVNRVATGRQHQYVSFRPLERLPTGLRLSFSIRDEKQLTCRNSTGALLATVEAHKIGAKGGTGGWARAAHLFTQI